MALSGRGALYMEMTGEGPGLLVLGGWGLSTGERARTVVGAWGDGRRTITIDYPGLGRSEPWDAAPSTRDLAEAVAADLARARQSVDAVVGQGGLGAGVAMHLVPMIDPQPTRLVLSAGWAGPDPYHDAQLRCLRRARMAGWDEFEELVGLFCVPPEVHGQVGRFGGSWYDRGSVKERRDAHLHLIDANISHDARAVLPDIRSRTLVVAGSEDLLGGPRLAAEVAGLISGSELQIMQGHPHSRAVKPGALQEYFDAVRAFLQG